MRHLILAFCFQFFFFNIGLGQWELVESLTAQEIQELLGLPFVEYGVDSYRVEYETTNIDGTPGMASGLITIPNDPGNNYPMLVFQHGTVNGRDDVPSNLAGGYQLGAVFGAMGYISLQPDYLGLGINPGVHPYIHSDSEAWVAVDMMRHVKEQLNTELPSGPYLNDQVFLSGYSQGGHASMALHKSLEEEHSDEFTVTATSHMSGPYSVSKEMIDFTLGEDEYFFCAYLAWVSLSMKEAYPVELADIGIEDIFRAQYVDDINAFANETIDLNELNTRLITGLTAETGMVQPKNLLIPEMVDNIMNNPDHPMSVALALQDNFDWTPQAPTRLMYCSGDDQVTFRNAIVAEETMNANGAPDVVGLEQGATNDHGACVAPAVTTTVFFFLNYRMVTTSTEETLTEVDLMSVNQHEEELQFVFDDAIMSYSNPTIELYGMDGILQSSMDLTFAQAQMDVSALPTGIFYIVVNNDGLKLAAEKIFIR